MVGTIRKGRGLSGLNERSEVVERAQKHLKVSPCLLEHRNLDTRSGLLDGVSLDQGNVPEN
jgi:hypothetical protein